MNAGVRQTKIMRYSLRTLFVVLVLVAFLFATGAWYPREKNIPLFDGNTTVAHYRGYHYSTKQVYLITVSPYDSAKGHWRINFTGPGKNLFDRYDAAGNKIASGECEVEVFGEWIWPKLNTK